jgi:hypothetical protein
MFQKRYTIDEAIAHCDETVVHASKELARDITLHKKYNQEETYV